MAANGLMYSGRLARYLTSGALKVAKGVGQTALGVAEGVTGARIDAIRPSASRYTGRAAGAGTRHAGVATARMGIKAAPMVGAFVSQETALAGKAAYNVTRGVGRTLTGADPEGRRLMNLYTGRQWRTGAGAVAGTATLGIVAGSAVMDMRKQNAMGYMVNPQFPIDPVSTSYDGLNATGDLTLALSRNRHG